MTADLWGHPSKGRGASRPGTAGADLDHTRDQYFTPAWAAEWLLDAYFPGLGGDDFVVDAGCGHGAFLGAVPAHVPAVGVEIDPGVARQARSRTGRDVITGDFTAVDLPAAPSLVIGNPPWREALLDGMLARAHHVLREGGRVGWVLPCYVFQTPSRVMRMADRWSIALLAMLPRTLFRGLKEPLSFVLFTKDRCTRLHGFALFRETDAVARLADRYRAILERAPRSAWVQCVVEAVRDLGGRATLQQIYAAISGRQPTDTAWWREKVRQVAQRFLVRVDDATYALAPAGLPQREGGVSDPRT